jgi:hypothetical protein
MPFLFHVSLFLVYFTTLPARGLHSLYGKKIN